MTARFFRRVRVPWQAAALFGVAFAATEVFSALLGTDPNRHGGDDFEAMRGQILILGAILYAGYRVVAFHPLANPKYRRWLATTPWTNRQSLPLGPVHPVLQDFVVAAGLVPLGYWRAHLPPVVLPTAMLGVYAIVAFLPLVEGKQVGEVVAMLWVAPLIVLSLLRPAFEPAVVAVLFGIALFGMSRGLERLPWTREAPPPPAVPLGWPFGALGPDAAGPCPWPRGAGVFAGLLVGWWAFAVVRIIDIGDVMPVDTAVVIGIGGSLSIAAGRLIKYVTGYRPPLGLLSRLRNGPLVIPGYDVVFVAPIAAALSAVAAALTLQAAGATAPVVAAVPPAVALAVAVELGPGLRAWRLTGHHRMHPVRTLVAEPRQQRRAVVA